MAEVAPGPDAGRPATIARTLHDEAGETELRTQGWTVVDLLTAEEVASLRDFYRSEAATEDLNPPGAFDSTYAEFSVIHCRPDFRARAFDTITAVAGPRAASLLVDHRPLVANFVNKLPGTGVVPMHQNWSVVDERSYRSVSVWIALVDCAIENGAVQFLPGSHQNFREPRGMWAYEAFVEVFDEAAAQLVTVPVRAGQAIVLDDAVVHYSPPNDTGDDRLAIQLVMVPSEAEPLFYQQVDSDGSELVADVWTVDPQFFFEFWHGDGDERHGRVIDRIRVDGSRLDAERFHRTFGAQLS